MREKNTATHDDIFSREAEAASSMINARQAITLRFDTNRGVIKY